MGKYEPLKSYMAQTGVSRIRLTFQQVEEILGFSLPPSARKHPEWWSNHTKGHSHSRAWVDEGWISLDVDVAGGSVTFARARKTAVRRASPHDIFGVLRGTVTYSGTQPLTDPTGEIWDAELGKS